MAIWVTVLSAKNVASSVPESGQHNFLPETGNLFTICWTLLTKSIFLEIITTMAGVDQRLLDLDILYNIEPESTPKYEDRGACHFNLQNFLY